MHNTQSTREKNVSFWIDRRIQNQIEPTERRSKKKKSTNKQATTTNDFNIFYIQPYSKMSLYRVYETALRQIGGNIWVLNFQIQWFKWQFSITTIKCIVVFVAFDVVVFFFIIFFFVFLLLELKNITKTLFCLVS